MQLKQKIIKVLQKLEIEYPNVEISLNFKNVYELLVATMLSAQSTDAKVNEVTPALFLKYPDVKSLANSTPDEIIPYIRPIGLYNTKSQSMVNMARKIVEDFDSEIPSNMKDLTSLPGVGRKTANVVLGNGYGITNSGITVDTHVIRLSSRIGLTTHSTAKKIEQDLVTIVPTSHWVTITHYFISHGRKVCHARTPKCVNCVISDLCDNAFNYD